MKRCLTGIQHVAVTRKMYNRLGGILIINGNLFGTRRVRYKLLWINYCVIYAQSIVRNYENNNVRIPVGRLYVCTFIFRIRDIACAGQDLGCDFAGPDIFGCCTDKFHV